MSSSKAQELRTRILDLVEEYQRNREQEHAPFVPGQSTVRYAGRVFGPPELRNAADAVLDFWLTAGRFSEEFEGRLAEFLGVSDVLMVNSGSSANLVAVTALTSPKLGSRQLCPGDEVITAAAAFPTTVAPIVQNRLVPVFVDVDLGGYNALPERIAEAVGPRTRAIILAHTLGNPWDVARIQGLAKRHGLWLIEDNCDALGSRYQGRLTGTFGDLATFSFYPAHHITTGEGGAVATNDETLAKVARSIRDWGRDCYCGGGENNTCGRRFSQQFGTLPSGYDHKYVYSHIGYNLKATDIQAAIGCAQMDRLEGFTAARKRHHAFLSEALRGYGDRLVLPKATEGADPSWFAFVLTVVEGAGFSRDQLLAHLQSHKIETRNLFSGNLLRHPGFSDIEHRVVGDLRNADRITADSFFVGVYPGLTEPELEYVADVFKGFMANGTTS
jgi:CDP-6-deoxy-D-xylo-4-hexulose-3-dehydrase